MSIVAQKRTSNVPTNYSGNKTISVNTVTDIDGNSYNTVKIGTQIWMAENLKTTKYRNGDPIPNVTDGTQWNNLTTGAYCDYNNTVINSITYGRLYNWYTVSDIRNIAPTGWHVPTDDEWTTLTTYLGGIDVAGGKLKESGTTHWPSPNTSTNESGFSALPGGYRYNSGEFNLLGGYCLLWSSTQNSTSGGWTRSLNTSNSLEGRYEPDSAKSYGFSVRCLRDPFIVNAGTDKSLFCENIVQLDSVTTNFTGSGTLKYKWHPSVGLNNDSIPNPIATVTENTTYTVTVTLPDGYSEQDSVQVLVKQLEVISSTPKLIFDENFNGSTTWPTGWMLQQTNTSMAFYSSKANISWTTPSPDQLNFYASSVSTSRGSTFSFPTQSNSIKVIEFDWLISSATISNKNAFALILDDSLSTNNDQRPILGIYMCGNDTMFHSWNLSVDSPRVFTYNGNFNKAGIDLLQTNGLNQETRIDFPYEFGSWYTIRATLDFNNGMIRELRITKKSNDSFVQLNNLPFVDSRSKKLSKIHVLNTRSTPLGLGDLVTFNTSFDNFKTSILGGSDSVNEIEVVCGGSIQLNEPKTNYSGAETLKYKWSPSDGLNNDSISNPTATVTTNTLYTVTVSIPNGCSVIDSVQVTVKPLTANAGINKTFVCGTTSQLEVTTNYTGAGQLSYKWAPSEGLSSDTIQNPIVHSFKTISYTVTVTTPNGCTATDIVKVQPSVSLGQKIRLVGVDSNNKNSIVWNVINPDFVDSVNVYRESDITDVFNRIGSAPYSASSYVDSLSNPNEKSNRYKITLRDKCGFETLASEPHKTMHLTINQGQSNSWNLILEPYDGFVVSTYKIYRGTSPESLNLLSSMAGSSYQFSDYNPPLGSVYYQVEVIAPSTQFMNAPSQLRAANVVNVANLTSSRSNIATNNTTGFNRLNNDIKFFTVSPNPAKEEVILTMDNISQSTVKLYDLVGRLVKIESVSGFSNPIDISDLPNALYVVEVRSGNKIGRQKLLVNK